MRILALLLAFFLFAGTSYAAPPDRPAYQTLEIKSQYPANQGMIIEFKPDEQFCRGAYGARWREKCAAYPGVPGRQVKGVRMKPEVKGHWQWQGSTSMIFMPENDLALKPGVNYSINLKNMHLPPSIKLDKKILNFHAWPQTARLLSSNFWIDPSPASAHRLSMALEFNYPIADGNVDIQPRTAQGMSLGEPELAWNDSHDKLNISWPVLKLPNTDSACGILVKNMGQTALHDGIVKVTPPLKGVGGTVFYQNIPAKTNIFHIKNAKIENKLNDNLDRSQELFIETSLYVKPQDLLEHLTLLELPRHNSSEAAEKYDWANAPAISVDVLKKAKKIKPEAIQNSQIARSKFNFKLPDTNDTYILAGIDKDLKSASGISLNKAWVNIFHITPGEGRIGFLQPGNILRSSGDSPIDIYSLDVNEIKWEARLVRDPFVALVTASSWNVFNAPTGSFNQNLDTVSSSIEGKITPPTREQGKAQFSILELGKILPDLAVKARNQSGTSGLVMVTLNGYKDGRKLASDSKMILLSNMGIYLKKLSDNAYECFAQNLNDGSPCDGAEVKILGANGLELITVKTDGRGHASIPSLAGLKRESRPVAVLVRKDGDFTFLPLNDSSREQNYSSFATGGTYNNDKDMVAYAFSRQGVYRPGDTLHFGVVTRNGDFGTLPENLPLFAELRDPRGMKIWDRKFESGALGLAELEWQSPEGATSGRYILNILTDKNGVALTSLPVRIEDFQPDTLKMKVTMPAVKGWLATSGANDLKSRVGLQNFYGTPAAAHKIRASLEVVQATFQFAGYEDFIFTDLNPLKSHAITRNLAEAVTDAQGQAVLCIPDDLLNTSSLDLKINVEGFDAGGGRAVGGQASIKVSPMKYILGYKAVAPNTDLKFINHHAPASVELVALDNNLEKIALKNLQLSLHACKYVTNLVSDSAGGYRYDDTPIKQPVRNWRENLDKNGQAIKLDTSTPGDFILAIHDENGRRLANIPFSVAGEKLEAPNAPLTGSRMRMRLDKEHYNAGDTIQISISLPYEATGLITLERNGVNAFTWLHGKPGENTCSLEIPEDFEGKGYIVASFNRSPKSTSIYMSPLAYAVSPFTAGIRQRVMKLNLEAAPQTRPGDTLEISLSSPTPGKAVLYAVDEGILQLTNYANPAPLTAMLEDRALDVRTLQAFDLLMPLHDKIRLRQAPFGGGMDGAPFGTKFKNPFKRRLEPPLTAWYGIMDIGPEKTSFKLPIPEYYNGSLRVVAVGINKEGAGTVSTRTVSMAPLVISPQIPLALVPHDEFEGILALENTTDKDETYAIKMELDKKFEVLSDLPQSVQIGKGQEIALPFKLKTPDEPGQANINFYAKSPGREFKRMASLSIRPATPKRTTIQSGKTDQSLDITVNRGIYPTDSKSVFSISGLPLPLADGLNRYLNDYPYGCTEQLISRSFAQILLLKSIPQKNAQKLQKLLDATVGAILRRYNGEGVGLWDDSPADNLLTVYATDFLLAMRSSSMGDKPELVSSLAESLMNMALLNESSLEAARTCAYAIWVLTREGRITTQLIENLLMSMQERGISGWRNDITAVLLAASQREMHMQKTISFDSITYEPAGWFDELAQYALHMQLLGRYFPEKCDMQTKNTFFNFVSHALSHRDFATFSANQAIRAIISLGNMSMPEIMQARVECVAPAQPVNEAAHNPLVGENILILENGLCQRYKVTLPPNSQGMFWQITTSGYDRQAPEKEDQSGIQIERKYFDKDGNPITRFTQGETVTVSIRVNAMQDILKDCVITDLLPGGCEMVIDYKDSQKLPEGFKFVDRQEDRLLLFGDLTSRPVEFTYQIRPVNRGTYTAPPVSAEAMYAPQIKGLGKSMACEIVK